MNQRDFNEVSYSKMSPWTYRFLFILVSTYLSMMALSYARVCLNSPAELIKSFINSTHTRRYGGPLEAEGLESMFGLLVAVMGIGVTVGGLTGSSLANCIGRKSGLLVSSVTGACGIMLMAVAETVDLCELLYVGRVVMGIAFGWTFSVVPTYITELCRPDMKALALVINMLFQSLGFILAQVLGFEELMGNREYWSELVGFPVLILVLHFMLLIMCPESPRYLLLKKNDEQEARKVFECIRGSSNVYHEILEMRAELKESSVQMQLSVLDLLRSSVLRKPLIIAVVLGTQQSWSGMNAIMFFSSSLFVDAGVSTRQSRYATAGVGAIFFLGTVISIALTRAFGRKTIFLIGTIGMGICSAILSLSVSYKDDFEPCKIINILVSLMIVGFYSLGPICVFWSMMSELFPHSARGAAFGVAFTCSFASFFMHSYLFPSMLAHMYAYTFLVFAAIDGLMAIFVVLYIPETKNRTFAEISSSWTQNKDDCDIFSTNYQHVQGTDIIITKESQ